jgi:hypothetical protein
MVKKFQIAPYLNSAIDSETGLVDKLDPEWTRICKTETFDLNMNPETEERDYIADELPTTELKEYNPSFSTPLVMHESEADYGFIFDKFFEVETGEKAKSEILLVFYQQPVDGSDEPTHFAAWRCDCTLAISDLNSVDSTITFDTNFNGEVTKGYVTISDGAITDFTEGDYS